MRKVFFYWLIPFAIFSEILTIHSLEEISLEPMTQKTLVLLDLDDVLIYPKDALLQNWRTFWKPPGYRVWTVEEDTIVWMSARFQLLDPRGPTLLETLNDLGIPTVGFTAFAMEQPSTIGSVPHWRSKHLEELGLHFRREEEVIFPIPQGFVPPSFEKGVLFCGDYYRNQRDNKGNILALYLDWLRDWLKWTPDFIVHVDDSKQHLESVQRELNRRGIPFLGYHYIPKAYDPIDERIAELQYKILFEQNRWLADEETRLLMKKAS